MDRNTRILPANTTQALLLDVNSFFSGGIDITEQLDNSLSALRDECEKQLAEGKRILIQ